jgi:farnesyl diphosphate synthase
MRHGALGGGKRLRPFLLIESARLCGASPEAALLAGAALELVHCYSLVHDDLPAMDDDDLRRGRPTVHKVYDDAMAILAGDSLLTLAFDVMSRPEIHADPTVRLELVIGLARASGLGGMAGGQALDLEAEGRYETDRKPLTLSETDIRQLQAMKTGALLLYAVEAGGVLGQADQAKRRALEAYGRAVGAAFQIADDILDVEADTATLGKEAGKDADRGKGTLVQRLGLDAAKAERDRLARTALEALSSFGAEADILRTTARFIVSRGH